MLYSNQSVVIWPNNDIAGNTGPSTLEMIEDNIFYDRIGTVPRYSSGTLFCTTPYDFLGEGLDPAPKIVELNKRIKHMQYTWSCLL